MAKYRQVHVEFWQDGFVLDLTPEEKYFYIYLLTNSKTSQCGIYELPKRIIETETGYNRETVEKLLKRFIDYGKIKYNDKTKEIFILNWIKYNWINSKKVIKCIEKELKSVKTSEFLNLFYVICKEYGYPIDTLSIDSGEEEEKEQEQEEEKEQQEEQKENLDDVVVEINPFDFYQQNFGVLNPFIAEKIAFWQNDIGSELVIEAMKRALSNQKKWSYAEGILKNWINNNIKTMDDVLAADKEFGNKQNRNVENKPNEFDQYADLF